MFSQDHEETQRDPEGYMHISKLQVHDNPIFEIQRFDDYRTPLSSNGSPAHILQFVSSNNTLCIATDNSQIQRWNIDSDEQTFIVLPKTSKQTEQVRKLFLDPSGHHLIVSTTSRCNFYLHSSKNKLVPLPKPKTGIIESVGWNFSNGSKDSTGSILLGLDDGSIHETFLAENRQRFCSKVFDLPFGKSCLGIEMHQFTDEKGMSHWFVMAASPQIHYQFIGGPKIEDVFASIGEDYNFRELPGTLQYGGLQFYREKGEAQWCAHMTGSGVYIGRLDFADGDESSGMIMDDKIISYTEFGYAQGTAPLSFALTEFHVILAYPDRVIGVNHLSKEIVFDRSFNFSSYGQMVQFSWDFHNEMLWLFSDRFVFEIAILDERRDVWKLYLEQQQFESAFRYASDNQKQLVLTAQANYLFDQGDHELSAHIFASSNCSFEQVSLKFINNGATSALRIYLLSKLQAFVEADINQSVGKFLTQRTMIATWLVELFLDEINSVKGSEVKQKQYETVIDQFKQFLTDFKDQLHSKTTFQLMEGHGLVDEMLFYGMLIEDWDKVLSYHTQNEEYLKALQVLESLRKSQDANAVQHFFYSFIPIIIQHEPKLTVDILLKMPDLNPVRLLPGLMRYNREQNHSGDAIHHAIRYLQYVIEVRGVHDPAVHNYLISLYAKEEDEQMIVGFIRSQEFNECYDMKYALRLCHQEHKTEAGVLIYKSMGLFSDAVALALTIPVRGFEVAKEIASQVPSHHVDSKKLWLLIGAYVVKTEKDVKKAMAILKECSLLHIEDILPLFPDDVQIGDFKDEISKSLSAYTERIEDLKAEMSQYTNTADKIRRDITKLRNRYGEIDGAQHCDLCDKPILLAKFILFPCTHAFHLDCASELVRKHLLVHPERLQYFDNDFDLDLEFDYGDRMSTFNPSNGNVKAETSERFIGLVPRSDPVILAKSECPFCGDVMIESVGLPLILESDAEIQSWEL